MKCGVVRLFSDGPSICIGSFEIVVGLLAIIAERSRIQTLYNAELSCQQYGYCFQNMLNLNTGIWIGILFIPVGVFGIFAGKTHKKSLVIIHGLFSILNLLACLWLITISGLNILILFSSDVSPSHLPYTRSTNLTCPTLTRLVFDPQTRSITPDLVDHWNYDRLISLDRPGEKQDLPKMTQNTATVQQSTGYWPELTDSEDNNDKLESSDHDVAAAADGSGLDSRDHDDEYDYYNVNDDEDAPTATTIMPTVKRPESEWRSYEEGSGEGSEEDYDLFEYDFILRPKDDFQPDYNILLARKKREVVDDNCNQSNELFHPWIIQLVANLFLFCVGGIVFILSIITATTACVPLCCPPKEIAHKDGANTDSVSFIDDSTDCAMIDIEDGKLSLTKGCKDDADDADDVPLLSPSKIVHV